MHINGKAAQQVLLWGSLAVNVADWPIQIAAGEAIIVGVNGGLMVTFLIVIAEGPLQPFAVTCIETVPVKPFVHVITPVVGSIVPAVDLLIDQLKPSLLVAVVVYPVIVVPLINTQVGSVPSLISIAVGFPTAGVGLTVIARVDVASGQTPLFTTALYLVVVVKLV